MKNMFKVLSVLSMTLLVLSCSTIEKLKCPDKYEGKAMIPQIKLGNEVFLEEHLDWVKGKKVGLVTNHTGIDSQLRSTADVLFEHPDVNLVALYGPEHGVRGNVTAGGEIESEIDKKTGLTMYSLYGRNAKRESMKTIKDLDVLVFDIQDIGSRSYTYITTMAETMIEAATYGKTYIVLDRPNPTGGNMVEGNILDPEFKSGIGFYPIPYAHGMTIGELAKLFNEQFNINCDLKISKMKGWRRSMDFADTGLQWITTSPHIPEPDTPFYYNITGIFGELNGVNIGVGYTSPFKLVGAPWIKGQELADHLNAKNLPGVIFSPTYYKPYYFHFNGEDCEGIRIHITDTSEIRCCAVGFHIMTALRDLYPDDFNFEVPENKRRIGMFDKACGTDTVRKDFMAGRTAEEIIKNWESNLGEFLPIREKYLIYK